MSKRSDKSKYRIDPEDPHLSNIFLTNYILSPDNYMTATERLTMVTIFSHRNVHSFACFPNLETIAKESALSRKTVRKAISLAAQQGELIRVVEVNGKRTIKTWYYATWDMDKAEEITHHDNANFWKTGYDDYFAHALKQYNKRK